MASGNFFGGQFFGGGFFGAVTSSGVSKKGKKKPPDLRINLKDVQDKRSTAEFLKDYLKKYERVPFEPIGPTMQELAAKAKAERIAAEEKKRQIEDYNEQLLNLLLLAVR